MRGINLLFTITSLRAKTNTALNLSTSSTDFFYHSEELIDRSFHQSKVSINACPADTWLVSHQTSILELPNVRIIIMPKIMLEI